MKPVAFLVSARADLRAERGHYRTIDPRLARRFQAAVEMAVKRMSRQPLLMEAKDHDIRRWPVGEGFPHGLLYRDSREVILVLAVFHPRRNPTIWKDRVPG